MHPYDPSQWASHESIYNAIYAYPDRKLKKQLIALLRWGRVGRCPPLGRARPAWADFRGVQYSGAPSRGPCPADAGTLVGRLDRGRQQPVCLRRAGRAQHALGAAVPYGRCYCRFGIGSLRSKAQSSGAVTTPNAYLRLAQGDGAPSGVGPSHGYTCVFL